MSKKIKDNSYICLSAILRAKEAKLLTASQIDRMLAEREFSDACRVATEGGYEDMSCMDVSGVNAALARFRARQVEELDALVPDPSMLDLFRMKYGYHNAKVLVKSCGDPEKYRHLLSDSARYSVETLQEIYRSDSGDGALTPGYARAIREARDVLSRTGNPQLSDFVLDKAYFSELQKEAAKSHKDYINRYVRMQIDCANIRSVIRTRGMERRKELLDNALIDGGSVSTEEIRQAIESGEGVAELYASTVFAAAAAAKDLSDFEKLVDNALRDYVLQVNYVSFGPETIIEYLSALEHEITSLRMILTGKLMGISEQTLKERLRDRYV